jgi:hypothetical protein
MTLGKCKSKKRHVVISVHVALFKAEHTQDMNIPPSTLTVCPVM